MAPPTFKIDVTTPLFLSAEEPVIFIQKMEKESQEITLYRDVGVVIGDAPRFYDNLPFWSCPLKGRTTKKTGTVKDGDVRVCVYEERNFKKYRRGVFSGARQIEMLRNG